jgi:hypothetical protein
MRVHFVVNRLRRVHVFAALVNTAIKFWVQECWAIVSFSRRSSLVGISLWIHDIIRDMNLQSVSGFM